MNCGTIVVKTRTCTIACCEAPDVAPIVLCFNCEARTAPTYKFNNSAVMFWHSVSSSQCSRPNVYEACAETSISELPVKILTQAFDSAARFPTDVSAIGRHLPHDLDL